MITSRISVISAVTILIIAAAALIGAFYLGTRFDRAQINQAPSSHPLLAKRLFIDDANDSLINFEPLRMQLREKLAYYDGRSSLYFEYLPTGTSVRIGDSYQSVAASLLKVPAVMELYRLADDEKLDLDKEVSIQKAWLDDSYGTLYKKGEGYTLTIRELVRIALEDSDNTAINGVQSIVEAVGLDESDNAYNALDIDTVTDPQSDVRLNARAYSSFLKCLYFACYASVDSSQEIMSYLTKSTEGKSGRLGKYIPDTVKIAHKIGVAGDQNQADCGIVYVDNRHYVLCVMINETEDTGSEVIAQASKLVYDYVVASKARPIAP